MIDLHCHIDLYRDPRFVVENCLSREVTVLSVTTTPSAWHGTVSLAPASSKIETSLGLHPHLAAERYTELALFDELLPSVRWVGEIGLDGAPEWRGTWKIQEDVFDHILKSCNRAGGRLLSVHSRRSADRVLEALKTHNAGLAVLHWFSGSVRELADAIDYGCWFSVGLPMLRSKKGQGIIQRIPPERLLTETDGPFTQLGTSPCYPWDVRLAIEELSKLWKMPEREVDGVLTGNLRRLLKRYPAVASSRRSHGFI